MKESLTEIRGKNEEERGVIHWEIVFRKKVSANFFFLESLRNFFDLLQEGNPEILTHSNIFGV